MKREVGTTKTWLALRRRLRGECGDDGVQATPLKAPIPSALLFDLLALSKGELTPSERLYVILNAKHLAEIHQGYLFDLYVACGCFDAALQITSKRSLRFLGDLAWAAGDFDKARQHYAGRAKIGTGQFTD